MSNFVEDTRNYFEKCEKIRACSAHSSKVHHVAWNCVGSHLASGAYDRIACTFQLESGRLVKDHSFRGHTGSVDQLCWHPKHPDLFATASDDKTVRLWDIRSKKSVTTITTKGDNINICWSPNGQTIAVGNKDDLISFIDAKTHKIKHEEQYKFEVNEITWNPAGDLFFITTGVGTFCVCSYPELKMLHQINAHPSICICIKFDPTGKHFAIGSSDSLVSLWSASELAPVRTYSRLDWPVRSISFSHDGKLLASASEDSFIDVSCVESGEKVIDIPSEAPTFSLAWHPTRYLLAFASDDRDKYRDTDAGAVKLYGVPTSEAGS